MRRAFVHEAVLRLRPGVDRREPGAAVTVALCGHWEHEGPCRWPHSSAITAEGGRATLRTVFVAPPGEETDVRGRIEAALASSPYWDVTTQGQSTLHPEEHPLAAKLAAVPPRDEDADPSDD